MRATSGDVAQIADRLPPSFPHPAEKRRRRYSLTAVRRKRLTGGILRVDRDCFGSPPAVDLDSFRNHSNTAFRDEPQRERVKPMLDGENSRGQPRFVVSRMDRHNRLGDYRPAIEFRPNEMHRASRE